MNLEDSFNNQHPAQQLVAIMQRIYDGGMTTTSGGNLSIMDDNGDMWITPGGIDKGTLTPDDIVCVKKNGTIVGKHKPSSEFPFHSAVYKKRHDVRALLHAHPPALVSFSVAGAIPNTAAYADAFKNCGNVGFAPYEVPGSEALGKNVSDAFKKGYSSILLENHGVCTVGTTILDAFHRFETLDFCARSLNNAIVLGTPHYLGKTALQNILTDRNTALKKSRQAAARAGAKAIMTRKAIQNFTRRAYQQKLFTSTQGTIAARLDKNTFMIIPAQCDRSLVSEPDIVKIDGNIIQKGQTPDANAWFFKQLFAAQPEINAAIIAAPPHIMGYALSHTPFDPRVIPESYLLLREVPAFKPGARFNQTQRIIETLSPRHPVVLLQNEGVITTGKTVLEAYDRLEVTEYSAIATIQASHLGGLKPMGKKAIDDIITAFHLIP